ncbi:MAG: GNAT family N-acetyltransferase, partial [Bacillota bacterium]|nr:GNAT family N-acetyltransferase [Bacillota bacterium]
MLIRTVKKTDENNLRQIWKDTFGDSDSFISWFFEKRFLPEYCVCAEENGKIVSCLHGYPMILNVGGKAVSAVTVSGVSTVPEYRHKGYMAEVFKFLMKKLHDQGMPLVFYTPVNANVYHFLDHLPVTRVLHAEHCTVVHCDKEYFAENISITENIDELWECYETFSQN